MSEVFNNIIKHPIRTTIIIGGIASSVISIIRAVKEVKSIGKTKR